MRLHNADTLNQERTPAKKYLSQTSGQWNWLAKMVWNSKARYDRFVKWSSHGHSDAYQKLFLAVNDARLPLLSKILKSTQKVHDALYEKDLFGNTLLHSLAERRAPDYLSIVASTGIQLETYNDDGYTALHLAAKLGRVENVKILIDNGANVLTPFEGGNNSAVHLAAKRGFNHVLRVLLNKLPTLVSNLGQNGSPPVHIAAWNGHIETVKYLSKVGSKLLDHQDDYGFSAMHYAVDRGHVNIVTFLIQQNVDLSLKTSRGHTALSLARSQGFHNIVAILEAAGAADAIVEDRSKEYAEANALYKTAKPYFNRDGFKKAKTIYQKVLKIEPNFYYAYSALGQIAFSFERDYVAADNYYDQSIAINPDYAENYYWKGRVNHLMGKPDVYRPLFIKYIDMEPDTYNSKDLKKNWSHLLVDPGAPDNSKAGVDMPGEEELVVEWISSHSNYIVIVLSLLLIVLVIVMKMRKR